jgi:cytochrome c oxidase assembly protein subunit 15
MSVQLIVQLLLIALFIGSIPLMINAYKGRGNGLQYLSLLTLFITFDLILFGAFTRLTDSGLGCPDWPGCYGHSNPLFAQEHIALAEAEMPDGPVTVSKAWIEMIHRYLASGVGFLILNLAIIGFIKRKELNLQVRLLTIGLFALVCLQGAFGALTVTLKLQPIIVSTHLLLALLLLMGLTVLQEKTTTPIQGLVKEPSYKLSHTVVLLSICAFQIFLGAWVSTNYAVLACPDFPTCNGSIVPQMDLKNGFILWRELGKTSQGDYLPIEALMAIHWIHRVFAILVFASILAFYFKYKNLARDKSTLWQIRLNKWLIILISIAALQLLTGLSNIVLQWPIISALMHSGGAALLILTATKLLLLATAKPSINQ